MELQHFSHEHPLILKEVQNEGEGDECFCYACEKVILDSAYNCGECSYFLHKSCAELPREVTHLIHSKHKLTLHTSGTYGDFDGYSCDVCRESINRFNYQCPPCDFNICMSCFNMPNLEITNEVHEHPLAPIFRPTSFYCDVCRMESKDMSYVCLTCQFVVHKSCLLLPRTINRSYHHHPLTLIYQYSMLTNFKQYCGICEFFISTAQWAYCCAPCRYFLHVKCLITTPETLRGVENENEVDQSIDPNLLHLPVTDGSLELARHFAKHTNLEDVEREAELIHWSHEHPLILFNVRKDDNIKDEIILCDGCVLPISFLFYRCDQCDYFLHLNCVRLQRELEFPIYHEHPLQLSQHSKFYEVFQCAACVTYNNGFFYTCKACEFFLDVKCAFLPTSIAHQSHKHPLVQMKGSKHLCKACDLTFSQNGFGCEACKFDLAHSCALLPHTITHRWDKHPLTLSYPPFSEHPDEFHCEMCEKEINPNYWIYHCNDCDQSFHPECIKDKYSNVKYGGTLKVNRHPHPLKFVRKARKRSSYYSCGASSDSDRPIFECGGCNYTLCLKCITPNI